MSGTTLLPHTAVAEVIGARDASLAKMRESVALRAQADALAEEARNLAAIAHGPAVFHQEDQRKRDAFSALFTDVDPERSLEAFREHVDARCWVSLFDRSGASRVMDAQAKEQFRMGLVKVVPELNEGNVEATFQSLDPVLMFRRGIANAFSGLDRRFRSHDAFRFKHRIVLTYVFDSDGFLRWDSTRNDIIADVERVFLVLDGRKDEDPGRLMARIRDERAGQWGARQSEHETDYFRVRCFQNGNVHLWFTRKDLLQRVNKELAAWYGEVLPDAVPKGVTEDDLRTKHGTLCRDLSFYATPRDVVQRLIGEMSLTGARVLEPSAGAGSIVLGAIGAGAAHVHAVEVHPGRAHLLRAIRNSRVTVSEANFLRMSPTGDYTHVLMNPPFSGTHWMEHVVHAFDFLAPGGRLIAVLPATAEVGDSRKHEAFRAWAKRFGDRWMFTDLPAESFASVGTRVNTVLLRLRKP